MNDFGATISEGILHLGFFAPCGLILALIIQQVFPVVPSSLLIGLGGALFGPLWGMAFSWIGVVSSSVVCYFLGFSFEGVGKKALKMKKLLEKRSFLSFLALRAIPLFPFNLVSLGAGALRLNFSSYLLATSIGILPNLALYAFLGKEAGDVFASSAHLVKTYFLRM